MPAELGQGHGRKQAYGRHRDVFIAVARVPLAPPQHKRRRLKAASAHWQSDRDPLGKWTRRFPFQVERHRVSAFRWGRGSEARNQRGEIGFLPAIQIQCAETVRPDPSAVAE